MANYADKDVAVAALSDKSTSARDLARIAILHPSLLPQVAAHPNADPEVLARVMENVRTPPPEPVTPVHEDTDEPAPFDRFPQPDEDVPAQAPRVNRAAIVLVAVFVALFLVVMWAATRTGSGGGMSQKQFERLVNVEWKAHFGGTPTISTTVGGCLSSARAQAETSLGTLYLASSAGSLTNAAGNYWHCRNVVSITDYVGSRTAYHGGVTMQIDSWAPLILVPEFQKNEPNVDYYLLMYKNVGLALGATQRSNAEATADRFKQAVDAAMQ